MILPIYLYGQPVLRKEGEDITPEYPNLKQLIEDMYETMYNADGVGLAAPQIGLAIRLFVVGLDALEEENPEMAKFKKVFINPQILEISEEEDEAYEGCLSIPGISEKVSRPEWIKIQYQDEHFKTYIEEYEGFIARVIQHEYDHIEGTLFTDLIHPLRRQMIKSKMMNITKGKVQTEYKVKR